MKSSATRTTATPLLGVALGLVMAGAIVTFSLLAQQTALVGPGASGRRVSPRGPSAAAEGITIGPSAAPGSSLDELVTRAHRAAPAPPPSLRPTLTGEPVDRPTAPKAGAHKKRRPDRWTAEGDDTHRHTRGRGHEIGRGKGHHKSHGPHAVTRGKGHGSRAAHAKGHHKGRKGRHAGMRRGHRRPE